MVHKKSSIQFDNTTWHYHKLTLFISDIVQMFHLILDKLWIINLCLFLNLQCPTIAPSLTQEKTTSDKALFLIQELLLSQLVKIPGLQGQHIYFLLHKNCIFVHARPSSYNGRSVISNNQIASVCEEIVVLKEKSCLDFIINRNGVFRTQRSTK